MSNPQQDILNDYAEPPKAASIGKRIGAAIIDFLVLSLLFYILSIPFGYRHDETTTTDVTTTTEGGDTKTTREVSTSTVLELNPFGNLLFLGGWFILMVVFEGTSGQTLGKRVTRIKVIRQNGEPGSIGSSFVRHLLDIVDCLLLIGLIIAASNPLHKRIGDMAAGTYVVDK